MRYGGIRRLLWVLALVATFVFSGSFVLVEYVFEIKDKDVRCLMFAGLIFGLWEVVELTVAIYLRRKKNLECVSNVQHRTGINCH